MTPLEKYLRDLCEIRSSGAGVAEESYYGTLETLFNEVGKQLKPHVRCIIQLANRGAGEPDGGLFTEEQYKRRSADKPLLGQMPGRGVVEIKSAKDNAWLTAESSQVSKYLRKYRQVLVTNYRDFVLLGQDLDGKPIRLETYSLAPSETAFWKKASNARAAAAQHETRFIEYLKRVMLHAAPLTTPKDLAFFLASYARDALARIEYHKLDSLTVIRAALEEALGLRFEGEKKEHFFRSTLVQSLFYGLFSAWVLWAKQGNYTSKDRFDWSSASKFLRVPVLRKLFHELADPGQLDDLRLTEVLDWTAATLNRIDRAPFFANFQESHAVQYFYEPFLAAFDPKLRKELGVWYTPPEIVRYMVARVDTVLREELGVPDGLADRNVFVLDPGGGTGSYLVEVLQRIHETLKAKGDDALLVGELAEAARHRILAFEILPASFVVAHLQVGLLLQKLGAPLSEKKDERLGIYLTNALTGWELRDQPPLGWPEMEAEREGAGKVKREKPILVVLGNPPYNAFAGISPAEEEGLVEPYKHGLVSEWKIKKFNLDDLYVRFFRLAERRIAEMTGRGVICYITNFSYLSDPSFVVMRRRFLSEFEKLWFDCMNGDSRETGKLTPEGKPDPSVFSTEYNREGIRVGTAIGLMVRGARPLQSKDVKFRNLWGVTKRTDLLDSLNVKDFDSQYDRVNPEESNRFSFRPSGVAAFYKQWPKLTELCAIPPLNGLMEKRGGALIDIDPEALDDRMKKYFDSEVEWETLKELRTGLTRNAARFDAAKARKKVLLAEAHDRHRICSYALRPFDSRWAYYSPVRPLWNEPRPSLWNQQWKGNGFLITRPMGVASPEGAPLSFTTLLGDNDYLRGHAYYFPCRLRVIPPERAERDRRQRNLLNGREQVPETATNLSASAQKYLEIFFKDADDGLDTAELIWMNALAIGYSPDYLKENADGILQDWLRVPLSKSKELLLASAALGRNIAALLDTETGFNGVTVGTIRAEIKMLGVPMRVGGGALENAQLAQTAGWGHATGDGGVMPGKGKLTHRDYDHAERKVLEEGSRTLGISLENAIAHLGDQTCDLYLNDVAFLSNVPMKVWDYTIGGYPVIKKWLSYREAKLLGRALTRDEVRYVQEMVRRISALLLLEPSLNANYQAVKSNTYPWPNT